MESFRSFILAAQKRKKCPPGYKFNKKLGVCVPIGQTQYYPYYGARGNGDQQTDTSNNNGQNGNGSNGNNQSGNGQSGGNGGNNNTGNGNGGNGS
jgi:hypothetical protein|tara:strand:+ start:292 stop:576 length:285 start_codon:yes stop_codon:yes gene_type:complete